MAIIVSLSSLHLVKNEDKNVDRMEKTCLSGKLVKCSIGGWVLSKFNVSFSHNHGTTFLCSSTEVAIQTCRRVDAINQGFVLYSLAFGNLNGVTHDRAAATALHRYVF